MCGAQLTRRLIKAQRYLNVCVSGSGSHLIYGMRYFPPSHHQIFGLVFFFFKVILCSGNKKKQKQQQTNSSMLEKKPIPSVYNHSWRSLNSLHMVVVLPYYCKKEKETTLIWAKQMSTSDCLEVLITPRLLTKPRPNPDSVILPIFQSGNY